MADAYSNYLRDALNGHLHGGVSWTPPATTYFALMTTMPTASGGGFEASGGSYARVAVTNNTSNWPASSGGSKQNANPIDWGTLSSAIGTIIGYAEYDASSGGNLITFALLTTPTTIGAGQPFQIPANGLTFSFDVSCAWSTYLQNKMNDLIHGVTAFTPPATTYFALMIVMDSAAGTGGTEVSGTGYARVAVTNNSTNWPASSGQITQNATIIDWGTAAGTWGSVIGVEERSASSGGNLLTFKTLTTPITITTGIPFQLPVAGFQNIWNN